MTTGEPDPGIAAPDIAAFARRVLDPETAQELLDELTHDAVSQLATDANNSGLDAQVALLVNHLGRAETTEHIHGAAKQRLTALLGATITSLQQVQALLHRDRLGSDEHAAWKQAVRGLDSLAEIEQVLYGFAAFGREHDQHLAQLWQTLTGRYRDLYRDRAHLLALIAGLTDLLADHTLAARAVLVEQPGGEWPVLFLELPPIGDTGPAAACGVQITRHIAPDDLHLFGPAIPLAEPAPVWDGSDTPEHHRRIQHWLARLAAARELDAGAGCECGEADRGAPGHDGGQHIAQRPRPPR